MHCHCNLKILSRRKNTAKHQNEELKLREKPYPRYFFRNRRQCRFPTNLGHNSAINKMDLWWKHNWTASRFLPFNFCILVPLALDEDFFYFNSVCILDLSSSLIRPPMMIMITSASPTADNTTPRILVIPSSLGEGLFVSWLKSWTAQQPKVYGIRWWFFIKVIIK